MTSRGNTGGGGRPWKNTRKLLKDGSVEFCFATDADTMRGSVLPDSTDELQRLFEKGTGQTLPSVEWLPPSPGARGPGGGR